MASAKLKLMGDDIDLGSVTDFLLRSFSTIFLHTQQCRAALGQKSNKRNPNRCHHALITQLSFSYSLQCDRKSISKITFVPGFVLDLLIQNFNIFHKKCCLLLKSALFQPEQGHLDGQYSYFMYQDNADLNKKQQFYQSSVINRANSFYVIHFPYWSTNSFRSANYQINKGPLNTIKSFVVTITHKTT